MIYYYQKRIILIEYLYTHDQLAIAAAIFLISDLSVYTTATLTNAINSKKEAPPKGGADISQSNNVIY